MKPVMTATYPVGALPILRCPHCGAKADRILLATSTVRPQTQQPFSHIASGFRHEIVHVQHGVVCNVTSDRRVATRAGCVPCLPEQGLLRACQLLRIPCFEILDTTETTHPTTFVKSRVEGHLRPTHLLWIPGSLVKAIKTLQAAPLLADSKAVKPEIAVAAWVIALRRAQGAPPEELDAANVLLALGEGLALIGDR